MFQNNAKSFEENTKILCIIDNRSVRNLNKDSDCLIFFEYTNFLIKILSKIANMNNNNPTENVHARYTTGSVVNIFDYKLTSPGQSLLSKGLSFCLTLGERKLT